VGLIIVLFFTNAYLYRSSAGELRTALQEVSTTMRKESRP
jgi:hypothetical protein